MALLNLSRYDTNSRQVLLYVSIAGKLPFKSYIILLNFMARMIAASVMGPITMNTSGRYSVSITFLS